MENTDWSPRLAAQIGPREGTAPFKEKPNTWTGIFLKYNFTCSLPQVGNRHSTGVSPASSGVWAWSRCLIDYLGQKLQTLLIFKEGFESLAFGGKPFFTDRLFVSSLKMMSILVVDGMSHGISVETMVGFDVIDRKRTSGPGSGGILSEGHLVTLGSGKRNLTFAGFP